MKNNDVPIDLNLFAETSKKIYDKAKFEERLIDNPLFEELRRLSANGKTITTCKVLGRKDREKS